MGYKKRGSRTSRAQYQLYLEELDTNKIFRENKFDGADPNIIPETWKRLKTNLNALGGSVHDVAGWKRVFSDWKSQVRARARKIKINTELTGSRGENVRPLNDLEERLLHIIGQVVVNGIEEVPEKEFVGDNKNEHEECISSNICDNPGRKHVNKNESENSIGNERVKISNTWKRPEKRKKTDSHYENKLGRQKNSESRKSPMNPVKKRKVTLSPSIQSIIIETSDREHSNNKIYEELKKIRKTTDKILKLKRMELSVKYPDYQFDVSDSDED